MKKVTVFILLKLAEIIGAIIAYLLVSEIGYLIISLLEQEESKYSWYHFMYFWMGLCSIGITIIILYLIYYSITEWIPDWIKANWKLADKISKK